MLVLTDEQLHLILEELRHAFTLILGDTMERMLLFGSYARGEAHSGSDIDVLVVMRGDFSDGDLIRCTSEAVARLSLRHDVAISRTFISQEHFEHEESPFMLNIRREALSV